VLRERALPPERGALPSGNRVASDLQQVRVIQQLAVSREDRGLVRSALGAEPRLKRVELRLGMFERAVERAAFLPRVVRLFNHAQLLVPYLDDVANRNAGRGGDTRENIRICGRWDGSRRGDRRHWRQVTRFAEPVADQA
jgi:hypothetical protein